MKKLIFHGLMALAVSVAAVCPSYGQWLTQSVVVTNGWTAAYLYVDASSENILPTTPGLPITADNPVDQVWLWKTPSSTAQYITTPESPLSSSGQWLYWSRTNNQNTLAALIPNAAYLIHSIATTNYTWKIKGKPVAPIYNWDMTGLNFIGFPTPSVNPPNFQNFLAPDPALAGIAQIFEYVGGPFSTNPPNPVQVFSQYTTSVTRGQAYWISATNIYNAYFGPFNVNLPTPGGLDYSDSGGQFTLHLVNVTASPLTVSLAVLPSETPPFGQSNIVAAPPMLLEGALNSSNLTYAYTNLPANSTPSASWTLAPYGQSGSDVAVVLGVNRFAMSSTAGSLYAGILRFTDSLGLSQIDVPVSATSANNTGLWVGSVNVTGVSYDLKSYATNSDGSLVISAVTNQLITTNPVTLGMTTNLSINSLATTNQTIDYLQVTNQLISSFALQSYQVGTNGYVLTTNQMINSGDDSITVIQTDVIGYYFTNNGGLLIWETTNTTNGPFLIGSSASTNQMVVTNGIAAVPTNGTPVVVTNWLYYNYAVTNEIVTNGIFEGAVTNEVINDYADTNQVVSTNAAYNVTGTNLVSTGTNTATSWLYLTNQSAGAAPLLASVTGGTSIMTLASSPPLVPGGTYYLGVQNPNNSPVNFGIQVNFHLVTNLPPLILIPQVVPTNGGYILKWSAPSNDLFQVQWSASIPPTWHTFTNPPYVSYNTNFPASATNAQFSFFDDGSQTGGSLPSIRFYRVITPGVSNLYNGQSQTNIVGSAATAYYAINVPAGADAATNTLLFAGAPVNLLFSTIAPAGINSGNYASSSQPTATSYATTNYPVVALLATTNYYPTTKPLLVTTNGTKVIVVNVVTNNNSGITSLSTYYTTNYQVISNNYTVLLGATNFVSSTTNLLATWNYLSTSLSSNSGFNIKLAIATNAAFLIATNAMISSVSNYVVTAYNTSLDAVSAPYPLRLLIFNDGNGNCSLLQRVYYGIRLNTNIVVATTESVLDRSHLNSARRISATHLPWTAANTPWAFTGGPLGQGGTLTTTVIEPYDDQPSNPFLHTYHPDHNNLDLQSPPHELPVGSESYIIKRQITLNVVANTLDFISLTTANSSLSGNYNETITLTGLGGTSKSYLTSGSFSLKRVSTIGTLTTH
jgi:hypothetical protein